MRRSPSEPPAIPGLDFVRLLGAGGFSDVFLYDQQLPRRRVAVKVLLTDGLDTAAQEAFVGEANLMAQLSAHPYIVTIFHADVAPDDRPYFVMEYCSGPSLADLYKRETFGVADALRTGIRLSSAIATAHGAGILHRDIKPANVLTNDFGWPALTDFGISSAVEEELPLHGAELDSLRDAGNIADTTGGTTSNTESKSVGMSVPWSPPEMFGDSPRPDVRSDVFSLAATIHTLLAGRTPFEIPGRSNGTLDLIGRIERGVITPIGRDDVPRSLTAVLQKGMATRRTERYASAIEFARALQRVELELGYAPTSIEVPNLAVLERETDAADSGEDETRVRSVATINAQPAVPIRPPIAAPPSDDETRVRPITVIGDAPAAPSASGFHTPADEGTVLRVPPTAAELGTVQRPAPKRVEAQSTSAPAPEPEPEAPAEPRRKLGRAGIISIAAVLVVAAVVTVAVVTSGTRVREEALPTPTATGSGQSAIVTGQVPVPVAVGSTANADNTGVTFEWSNPSPEEGDTYRWAFAEQPAAQFSVTETSVTVPRTSPEARVCIQVVLLRAGRTSPQPVDMCNPS